MRRRLLMIVIGLASASIAYAQEFEVASIRVNKADYSGVDGKRIDIQASPGSLIMRNVTLQSCIRWAYGVRDFQIAGGSDWRGAERYDIIAKPAAAASEDQLRLMLRALLADRFKLTLSHQSRELPVYVLLVGKNGHRLQRSKTDGPRTLMPTSGGLAFQNATMSDLEQFLSSIPAIDRPVLDRTGIEGAFDFSLSIFDGQVNGDIVAAKSALAGAGAPVYADALERLGLKLESTKVPLEMLTIEHAEKPAGN